MTDHFQPIDLRPATGRLAELVAGVRDDQLDLPTPCDDYTVAELLGHIDDLAHAFASAATKQMTPELDEPPPVPTGVEGGWRTRIPERLAALGEAWQDPAAWDGMTKAGGIEMPGGICGMVAIDEVVVHGWDLARATLQPYDADETAIRAASAFAAMFTDENRGDGFKPPVPVADDAPALDRLIGAVGRDPAWSPPAAS